MKGYDIAIVGATGLVGTTLLHILEERHFPLRQLHLVASQHSSGKTLPFGNVNYTIQDLDDFDFSTVQISFFCVSNQLAAAYIPKATAAGNIVIDKSFHYRRHTEVPLIIPEVNLHDLSMYRKLNIIANPNCTTIPIAVGLKPIYDAVGIDRINISTYQSVSGTGKEGIAELEEQSKRWLSKEKIEPKIYKHQIAFNVLPHCDEFQDNGYTREEMKIVWEMRKIYNDETLAINPTAVRVPVFCGHAAAVHLETKEKLSAQQAQDLLRNAPGVKLITGDYPYSTPAQDAVGNDHVYVGRIREDISHPKGLNLWVVADNLRKGAALNAVQIVEHLIRTL